MAAHRVTWFVLSVCCALLAPALARAQSGSSAAIVGMVKDTTGAVLPGVTVEAASPALIERVRTAVTDEQGSYRILDLRPGTYSVTFTLPGFNSLKRDGITLTTGFSATVNADLPVGALEETVIVSGESPLVDVRNVRTQQVLSREDLDALPTFRTGGGFMALTVGASLRGTQDVGGSSGENITTVSIHGSRGTDFRWKQDGMSFGSNLGSGFARTHRMNVVSVQETAIEQGGTAESETGGANINYIPRDGGNNLSVYMFSNYTDDRLQSDNLSPELRDRGLTQTPTVKQIWDYGIGVGGPLRKDRLWFYQSNRWWGGSAFQPGAYFNSTVGTPVYTPDLSRPAWESNWARDFGGRLTWQAAPKHKIAYSHSMQENCNCISTVSSTVAPEAAVHSDNGLNHLVQATWNSPASNRLLFEAGVSALHAPQSSHLVYGTTADTVGIRELSTGLRYNAKSTMGGATDYGEDRRSDNVNGRFTMSYVTPSHVFKTGFTMLRGFHDQNSYIPQSLTYQFRNGVPASLIQWASPEVHRVRLESLAFFAQDQWTIKRLTVNPGVRIERFRGWGLAETAAATQSVIARACPESTRGNCTESSVEPRFLSPRDLPAVDDVPNFSDVSPRLSASYDMFGSGRTAVKASLNRYVGGLGAGFVESVHPALAIVNNTTRTWTDTNGNFVPDCNLRDPGVNGECGAFSNSLFGTPVINTRRTPEVTEGFGNREYNWQASAGVQHELRTGIAAHATYYRTWFRNFTATDNQLVTPADYDPYCITAPTDSRLPGGGGTELCGLFDIRRASFGRVDNLIRPAGDFGDRQEVYNSVDVGVNARLAGGAFLSSGVSVGRTTTRCVVVDSPQEGRPGFCDVTPPWSSGAQVKLNAVYPLPWWGVQSSLVFQNLPGVPITAELNAPNSAIAPSLGRNLAACPAATGACTATAVIGLVTPETMYEDRLTQVDIRISKIVRVGRGRLTGMLDVYNLLNANTVLGVNTTYGPQWLRPTRILSGRLFKFGAEVNF